MALATALVWNLPTCVAADDPQKPAPSNSSQGRDDDETNPSKRIDKAIEAYERRADSELEQVRKEILKSRRELSELNDLQYDLAISLAELQAELRVMVVRDRATDGDGNPVSPGQSTSTEERQRLRAIELARELRQVQETLRSLVQQKRSETDQLVLQLRNLRSQQRQLASQRAPGATPDKPSRD
jgi:hypothetical protein